MRDICGRSVRCLRLSVTGACGMRCVYCRPAGESCSRHEPLLLPDEIEAVVRRLVEQHGLRRVRLTGGEPTSRPDLLDIIGRLAGIRNLKELLLTTNGLTLARQARDLARAGLRRVNVSLDSLSRRRFQRITGVDGVMSVVAGVDAAISAGLVPIRINTVVMKGVNDDELRHLIYFAAERGAEIRFIELMPMGPLADLWSKRFVPERRMWARLIGIIDSWEPLASGSGPARRYRMELCGGGSVIVGFIASMSRKFCSECDRIRIAADGSFYPCLMGQPVGNLLPAIRPVFDAARFDRLLESSLATKAAEGPAAGVAVMQRIGG